MSGVSPTTAGPAPVAGAAASPAPVAPPWWPGPRRSVPWSSLVLAVGAGVVAALTLVGARAGLQVAALLLTCVGLVVVLRRGRGTVRGDTSLLRLAAVLAVVPVLRAEPLLVALAVAGSLGLLGVVALRRRRWPGVLLSGALGLVAVGRAAAWLVARPPVRVHRPQQVAAWFRGAAAGLALAVALVVLLASADAAFARLVDVRLPDDLAARAAVGVGVAGLLLGLTFATLAPPRPDVAVRARPAPAAEWALPLVLADAVLVAFLLVQGAVLFDPAAALSGTGVTPAQWARQGFGQLVAVTVLLLAALGWAVRRIDAAVPRHVRLLRAAGGLLSVLVLAVVASALSRMAFYSAQFGATSLRLYVVVFEVWLAVVVVLVAVTWALGRAADLPRAVVGTAAAALALLAVLGPDATAAAYNVERFAGTGQVDTAYLRSLSADAVPALSRLPEPERSCALAGRTPATDPWYAWNVGRARGDSALTGTPVPAPAAQRACAATSR